MVSLVRQRWLTTQRQYRNTRRHFTLNGQRHLQHKLLDPLDRPSLHDSPLVPLATRREVSQRRNGVTLDLFILIKR